MSYINNNSQWVWGIWELTVQLFCKFESIQNEKFI